MTVNSGSDFSGVKVGDSLWYMDKEVRVVEVDYSDNYPLLVRDIVTERCLAYSFKGQDCTDGPQVLFYSKVEITPPPRPKSQNVYKVLSREEIEELDRRQNLCPERVDLPGVIMGRIVETLMVLTTPEEVLCPEKSRPSK